MSSVPSLAIIFIQLLVCCSSQFHCPWSRPLTVGDEGNDVLILQNLLARSPYGKGVVVSGVFEGSTKEGLVYFQGNNSLSATGAMDLETSQLVLQLLGYDGYKDDGGILAGYLYKIHIRVSKDRNVETVANLYNDKMELLLTFPVRLHGQPDRNQFCTNGDTPTGLFEIDLNSPESNPVVYGPYNVNRIVQGLAGNGRFLVSNDTQTLRRGLLIHTGEWQNWSPPQPMPNSDGCIHTWPDMCKKLSQDLQSLGVIVRKNTDGLLPYPYTAQGLISIEEY